MHGRQASDLINVSRGPGDLNILVMTDFWGAKGEKPNKYGTIAYATSTELPQPTNDTETVNVSFRKGHG